MYAYAQHKTRSFCIKLLCSVYFYLLLLFWRTSLRGLNHFQYTAIDFFSLLRQSRFFVDQIEDYLSYDAVQTKASVSSSKCFYAGTSHAASFQFILLSIT